MQHACLRGVGSEAVNVLPRGVAHGDYLVRCFQVLFSHRCVVEPFNVVPEAAFVRYERVVLREDDGLGVVLGEFGGDERREVGVTVDVDEVAALHGLVEGFEAGDAWDAVGYAQPEPDVQRVVTPNPYPVDNVAFGGVHPARGHQDLKAPLH